MDFIEGEIFHIDKPLHWTSFKVVKIARGKLCNRLGVKKLKVGHTGTLDPLATGVMTICTGRKTKLIEELQALTKEYVANIRLGATTPSFDRETEIDAEYPTAHITQACVEAVLQRFTGTIEQVPPAFSACKVNGKRAYKLARKNKTVELKAKTLVIDSIELISCNLPDITIRIVCSKGTYIRALARDIGTALDSGGHLTGLIRTGIGDITLDKCLKIEELDRFFDENIEKTEK